MGRPGQIFTRSSRMGRPDGVRAPEGVRLRVEGDGLYRVEDPLYKTEVIR